MSQYTYILILYANLQRLYQQTLRQSHYTQLRNFYIQSFLWFSYNWTKILILNLLVFSFCLLILLYYYDITLFPTVHAAPAWRNHPGFTHLTKLEVAQLQYTIGLGVATNFAVYVPYILASGLGKPVNMNQIDPSAFPIAQCVEIFKNFPSFRPATLQVTDVRVLHDLREIVKTKPFKAFDTTFNSMLNEPVLLTDTLKHLLERNFANFTSFNKGFWGPSVDFIKEHLAQHSAQQAVELQTLFHMAANNPALMMKTTALTKAWVHYQVFVLKRPLAELPVCYHHHLNSVLPNYICVNTPVEVLNSVNALLDYPLPF